MTDQTIDMPLGSRECPECGQRFSRDGVFCPFDGTRLEGTSVSISIDPLMGSTIDGRYEVIELLGEGGMGRVYSVLHVGLGRLFALKALRRELAKDEELSQRFIREAKAMAAVRHPHIVEITDFGRLPDGVPYFVMEMLVGETLSQLIKRQGFVPVPRGIAILEQVASALVAAHEAGVVHRDLKPENVFLVGSAAGQDATDDVRVVDFGAAKIVGSSQVTRNGVVFGTPYYMSPEQASGSPVDGRTDVYSLGVIMYEMFTGKVPFEGDTYMNVLTQHMFVEPEPPSQRSPLGVALGGLDELTMACLAKRPEKRPGSMNEVLDAVRGLAQGVAPRLASRAPAVGGAEEGATLTLAEIRAAIESSRPLPAPVPWGWIAVAAVGIGGALGAFAWEYVSPRSPPEQSGPGPSAPRSVDVPASIVPPVGEGPAAAAPPSESGTGTTALAAGTAAPVPSPPTTPTHIRPHAAAPPGSPHRPKKTIDDVTDPFAGR